MTKEQYTNIINAYKSLLDGELNIDAIKEEHKEAVLLLDKQNILNQNTSDIEEYIHELEIILYR